MEHDARKTILAIEEDAPLRMSIAAYLEDQGYQFFETETGRMGLEMFRQQKPDLVLVDLYLPEMERLEILSNMAKESPDTPIIIISDAGIIKNVLKALRFGAWDYILKPITDMDVLRHAINKALERAELLKEKKMNQQLLEQIVSQRTARLEQEVAERRRMEEALKNQYNFLQTLIDAIPTSVFFKDTQGLYLGCNNAYSEFLGLKKNEIIGKGVYDVFPKDLADIYDKADKALLAREGHQFYESKMDHADGTRRDVFFNKATYTDKKGNISGVIGAMIDITELKNIEKELLKEKNFSEFVLNSLPGIFYLFDEQGHFIRWNENFETVTAYSAQEIQGMKPADFFNEPEKNRITEIIHTVFTHGKASIDSCLTTKNGRNIPYHFTGFRVTMGEKNHFLGVAVDTSMQKQAEKSLRESEKRYRAIVEDIPGIVCRFTKDGWITFVNKEYCQYFNRRPEETIGMDFFSLIPRQDRDTIRNLILSLDKNKPMQTHEMQAVFPDKQFC